MLWRLIDFVVYVIIALIVGYVLTLVVGIIPVVPETIKDVLNIVIWAIIFIAILLAGVSLAKGTLPSMFRSGSPPA